MNSHNEGVGGAKNEKKKKVIFRAFFFFFRAFFSELFLIFLISPEKTVKLVL